MESKTDESYFVLHTCQLFIDDTVSFIILDKIKVLRMFYTHKYNVKKYTIMIIGRGWGSAGDQVV